MTDQEAAIYSAQYILEDANLEKLEHATGLPMGVIVEAMKNIFKGYEQESEIAKKIEEVRKFYAEEIDDKIEWTIHISDGDVTYKYTLNGTPNKSIHEVADAVKYFLGADDDLDESGVWVDDL